MRELSDAGVGRGTPLAVVPARDVGVALVAERVQCTVASTDPATTAACLAAVDDALHPRWVVWSRRDSGQVLDLGVALSSCWDIAAVHRLVVGGARARPGDVWAHHAGLDPATVPDAGRDGAALDLFTAAERSLGDPTDPVRPDGHLRPEWGRPGWRPTAAQLEAWAATALQVAAAQMAERVALSDRPRAELVARSESTAELLCNELTRSGLPVDLQVAEAILAEAIGPRPASETEAAAQRAERDAAVLRHLPAGAAEFDLRSAGQVKSLLRRLGIEVEDTRAWRLERLVGTHPVIEDLLVWRKRERIATTFGYAWLDEHLGDDSRLRGRWAGSDGAAGRMTATAGLHNMTAELRPAVAAEQGHVLVRSDLGQIEPRVLAAVSGDRQLARASAVDDLYAGVADALRVERDIAKVAVLGAMYGQTTGRGAQALAQLRSAYPVAMALLDRADRDARAGADLFTYGGRRIRMDAAGDAELPEPAARSRATARGRYGRNAVIQGAAAELFKMWAVTVRARVVPLGAEIVLCLHDELLVHTPAEHGPAVAALVDASLQEAVRRWAPDDSVRFVTDTSLVERWSDAKG